VVSKNSQQHYSRLGGVVVNLLATGPKSCEFEQGQGNQFLWTMKIRSTPSFGWEVKPELPYLRFYSMLKIS
jgi:hypothetical protein